MGKRLVRSLKIGDIQEGQHLTWIDNVNQELIDTYGKGPFLIEHKDANFVHISHNGQGHKIPVVMIRNILQISHLQLRICTKDEQCESQQPSET